MMFFKAGDHMKIESPEWVKHALFYQIFPDRFNRSKNSIQRTGLIFKPWGTLPKEQGYQGGDLYGILEKVDYLKNLGVNALYLNPIFASASNHRYHTYDYYCVDPLLGGNAVFREFLDEMHEQGFRIILDGVFNHVGRGFWAFHHILENGGDSPYIGWFTIKGWPMRPYNDTLKKPANYEAWHNLTALPKLNHANADVRQYIYDVARYWLDFGIDGWRLDVPEEIKQGGFWEEFRQVVKEKNPEAYLVGEIWHPDAEWLNGSRFDGLMNYPLGKATLGFFGANTLRNDAMKAEYWIKALDAEELKKEVASLLKIYDDKTNLVQMNLLDSHDTSRALWLVGGDKQALKLSILFLMAMPGAPCVYYGDEIGMSAGDDPDCREAFPWNEPDRWDNNLLQYYQKVIALRKEKLALRIGNYTSLLSRDGLFAFSRRYEANELIVVFNSNSEHKQLELNLSGDEVDVICIFDEKGENQYHIKPDKLMIGIQGRQGMIFSCSHRKR